jgi:hypothetical protein
MADFSKVKRMKFQGLFPGSVVATHNDPGVARLQDKLDAIPFENPVQAARLLTLEFKRSIAGQEDVHRLLALLEPVGARAGSVLAPIEESLNAANLPLAPILRQAVKAAGQLLKDVAAAYTDICRRASGMGGEHGSASVLRLAVVRAMELNARRLSLAHRAYMRGSAAAWDHLHRLYSLAVKEGFAAAVAAGESSSPERLYLHTLLLAYAGPTRFVPGELDWAQGYIERHGSLARLRPLAANQPPPRTGTSSGRFLVRSKRSQAEVLANGARTLPVEPGDLILDCGPLVEHLRAQLAGVEERRTPPSQLGLPTIAVQRDYRHLLHHLLSQWSVAPRHRSHHLLFPPPADAVFGFERVWAFVDGQLPRASAGGHEARAQPLEGLSQWSIVSQSLDGMGLRHLHGDTSRVRVGEVLALRPRERDMFIVCVSRQALNHHDRELELRVDELAVRAAALTISLKGASGPRQERVVLLPAMPALNNAAGLIAMPGCVATGTEIRLRDGSQELLLRVSQRIERTSSCEVFTLAPAGAQHRPERKD